MYGHEEVCVCEGVGEEPNVVNSICDYLLKF